MVLSDKHLHDVRKGSLQVLHALWQAEQTPGATRSDQVDRWSEHGGALIQYARSTDEEWRIRRDERAKYSPTTELWQVRNWLNEYRDRFVKTSWTMPWWFGNTAFHQAERELLCQLDPVFYDQLLELTTTSSDNYRG